MTRRSKNVSAGRAYTNNEKRNDSKCNGYGTTEYRISKDSIKEFDCCCLTLQPCRNPVITLDGYLYDKEAILEYMIYQKKEIAKKMKEYETQQKREEKEMAELVKAEERSRNLKFMKMESSIVSNRIVSKSSISESTSRASYIANRQRKMMPSFWIPSLTTNAKNTKMKKPENSVLCPMSGKPLKVKNLTPVKFTEVKNCHEQKSLIAKKVRYMCAVTHDILGNSVPVAVLCTSGNVVTMECVTKLIKKDMIDPTNGLKLTDANIIPLQRGGTGYSSTNNKLKVITTTSAMMA
ncbi:unnamed protein product [Larinioides sclopetarius]|uniref:Nitric oxide synthase-interacting protein homolog n=1 Tax=Larinioides sclopetarius TaxID=280406 RepID=A0AAV2BPG1_9ARAC